MHCLKFYNPRRRPSNLNNRLSHILHHVQQILALLGYCTDRNLCPRPRWFRVRRTLLHFLRRWLIFSRLNANAQVGRRFESEADTSDSRYVSESESDGIPDCRIINARGVKKVIRSDGSVCRGADGRPTTEDDENDDDDNRTNDGNVPDPIEGER